MRSIVTRYLFKITALGVLSALAGCAAVPRSGAMGDRPLAVETAAAPADSAADAERELPRFAFDPELYYQVLEAEIALQARYYDIALRDFRDLALSTRDPRLAERAAKVAFFVRDDAVALEMVKLWQTLEPRSIEARQMLVVAYIRARDREAVLEQLDLLMGMTQQPDQVFVLIASLLSREQDLQSAVQVVRDFVEAHPENRDAWFAYAHLALRAGAVEEAATAVERTLRLAPDWSDAIALKVRILALYGQPQEALDYLAGQVRRYPAQGNLRMLYARMLMDMRRFDQAIVEYQRLSDQLPGNGEIVFTLGLLSLQLNRLPEAEEYLQEARRLGVTNGNVQFYLGWVEELKGNPEAAVAHYQAVGHGENYLEARIRIAVLWGHGSDVDRARILLADTRGEQEANSKRLYQVEGEILRDAGRFDEALEVYNVALEEIPGDIDLLYARGLLGERMDRLDILESDLRSILARNPNHVDALNGLGYTLADRTDRYQEAFDLVARALELNPQSGAILDSMGWVLYRLGRYPEAIKYLRRSLDVKPDHEVAAHLGEVLWVSGAHDEAVQVWEQALELFPGEKTLLDVMRRFGQ